MIGILFLSEESVLLVIVTAHVLSHKTPLKILNSFKQKLSLKPIEKCPY